MAHGNPADKRRYPRLRVELPVHARLGGRDALTLQLADISARGMQLKMKRSDFETLRNSVENQGQEHNSSFEIRITARLAWVMPDTDGAFATGWEFNFMDEEEQRIG